MNNQKLLESMNKYIREGGMNSKPYGESLIQEAIAVLSKDEWVECSEEMPEVGRDVLIWHSAFGNAIDGGFTFGCNVHMTCSDHIRLIAVHVD